MMINNCATGLYIYHAVLLLLRVIFLLTKNKKLVIKQSRVTLVAASDISCVYCIS